MPSNDLPLISCVCVTKNKTAHLKRAIDCFRNQTYSHKELIVIYENNDPATRELSKTINDPGINFYEVPYEPKLSLGELRNLSISKCNGSFFCQWDDDDWYHAERLTSQMNAITFNRKDACILVYWLMYDSINKNAFLSPLGPWAGTILCRKALFTNGTKYPDLSKKEDHVFIQKLLQQNCVFPLIMPSLYIYCYHGNNTFGQGHFNSLFTSGQKLSPQTGQLFSKIFENEITNSEASQLMFGESVMKDMNFFK